METTERIVNSYCNHVLGWFTIQNIKCPGQQEIDILAIDPNGRGKKKKYHIECSVSISKAYSKLTARPYDEELRKQRVHQAQQRMTIGYFIEKKFGSPDVLERLAEYGFEGDNYSRVVVASDWQEDVEPIAAKEGVLLWSFYDILNALTKELDGCSVYYDDDTCRTIQLMMKARDATLGKAAKKEPEAWLRTCECGCGQVTTRGRKFKPGHDGIHKSNLFKLAREGNKAAMQELNDRNWPQPVE